MIQAVRTKDGIFIGRDEPLAVLFLSYPEANALQADLRKILVEAGITMNDAF